LEDSVECVDLFSPIKGDEMIFRTIRSRLALSFLGIALVATLAHAVSLAILQKYHANPGLDDLRQNAQAIRVLAGAIAVLLAATVGWYISYLISAPVRALTSMTDRMPKGKLSSRVNVKSLDEFEQLELSINELTEQVETSATTLQRFVVDAAHELHTPLTALRANLDLALHENNAADQARFLLRAQGIVKRLEELNTNLLELSHLEANSDVSKEAVFDLAELLRQRIEIYASQAEQAELRFEEELPVVPMFLCGNPDQITRAMNELVENACKFTPQDGIIRVALSQQKEQAVFSVIDTGIGVPPADLPLLFDRFQRGKNAGAYPGSGLGLAIVKAIVTAHGGQVEAQSLGEGKGSRFAIQFPAVPPQSL
jgi:signal transduction histidine kinase